MSWLGELMIGDLLPGAVLCTAVAQDGVPTLPDASPVLTVYSDSGIVESRKIPMDDSRGITGRFRYLFNLDGKYSTGQHWILVQYQISGTVKMEMFGFEIVGGGGVNGTGIACEFFRSTIPDYLIVHTDNGTLLRKRNPSVVQ